MILVVVVLLIAGGVFWFLQNQEPAASDTNQTSLNTNIPELPSTFNQIPDQDRDRITDNQEKELGTNPEKADTDDDQLSDYDEVSIYNTDPLNPDTDGDGFSDGYEVAHGFNPAGEGELLNINSALQAQP